MPPALNNIRIVIPAYNANGTIIDCIEAILKAISFCKTSEIIVVDNSQNNDLLKLPEKYTIHVLKRNEISSAAYARNEGAEGYYKGILVFIDSDVICETTCIEQLVKPIQENLCHATIGNYSKNLKGLTFSQKYKQLYINYINNRKDKKIKNDFWTAISAVDAAVFHELNGFNSNFKSAVGEDQEFGIRLTKNNFDVLSVAQANGQHRNPYNFFRIIRNDLRKGINAVENCLTNKVPISDNRHAGKKDMLSVLFSTLASFFLLFGLLHPSFLFFAGFSSGAWFVCRLKLSLTFYKNDSVLFYFKAIGLMYILDLVRFICVIIGIVKNISKKNMTRTISLPTTTQPIS